VRQQNHIDFAASPLIQKPMVRADATGSLFPLRDADIGPLPEAPILLAFSAATATSKGFFDTRVGPPQEWH
jgi:hypothetical protein